MKKNSIHFGILLGLLAGAAENSTTAGTVNLYTDRISWEAAMGGGVGNITDNLDSGSQSAGTINRGSYVIYSTDQGAFPNGNPQTAIDGTGYLRVFASNSSGYYTMFTFNSPTLALGYDINPQPFNLGATIDFSLDGTAAGSYNLPALDVNGFVGIVSDTAFTTFKITTTANTAWHGVDNLEAYSAPVPEPSVVALGVVGFVGVGWLSRRKK